jgi:hypothetical protein
MEQFLPHHSLRFSPLFYLEMALSILKGLLQEYVQSLFDEVTDSFSSGFFILFCDIFFANGSFFSTLLAVM